MDLWGRIFLMSASTRTGLGCATALEYFSAASPTLASPSAILRGEMAGARPARSAMGEGDMKAEEPEMAVAATTAARIVLEIILFLRMPRHMHVNTTPYLRKALNSDLEVLCGDRDAVGSCMGGRDATWLCRGARSSCFRNRAATDIKSFRCFGVDESNKLLDFLASRK